MGIASVKNCGQEFHAISIMAHATKIVSDVSAVSQPTVSCAEKTPIEIPQVPVNATTAGRVATVRIIRESALQLVKTGVLVLPPMIVTRVLIIQAGIITVAVTVLQTGLDLIVSNIEENVAQYVKERAQAQEMATVLLVDYTLKCLEVSVVEYHLGLESPAIFMPVSVILYVEVVRVLELRAASNVAITLNVTLMDFAHATLTGRGPYAIFIWYAIRYVKNVQGLVSFFVHSAPRMHIEIVSVNANVTQTGMVRHVSSI